MRNERTKVAGCIAGLQEDGLPVRLCGCPQGRDTLLGYDIASYKRGQKEKRHR